MADIERHGPRSLHRIRIPNARQNRPRAHDNAHEIARTAGLGKNVTQRKDCTTSQKRENRLRETIEILNEIEPRFRAELMAYAWYRSEPLPGFSGQAAMQLVRAGRAAEALDYVDAVDAGVFA